MHAGRSRVPVNECAMPSLISRRAGVGAGPGLAEELLRKGWTSTLIITNWRAEVSEGGRRRLDLELRGLRLLFSCSLCLAAARIRNA